MPPRLPVGISHAEAAAPRIVLDTNVCLDLFVFREPLCSHLLAALQRGAVRAVTRADCRAEWQRVLHYPKLAIEPARQLEANAAYDRWVEPWPESAAASLDVAALPRCADPDDQMFLELALASDARWLLSKDNELLKLDRRTRAAGLFAIVLPQCWSVSGIESPGA